MKNDYTSDVVVVFYQVCKHACDLVIQRNIDTLFPQLHIAEEFGCNPLEVKLEQINASLLAHKPFKNFLQKLLGQVQATQAIRTKGKLSVPRSRCDASCNL